MNGNIIYPVAEQIIEYNVIALEVLRVKKADTPKVLSHQKIAEVINNCRQTEGDIYDKAVALLIGLVRKHPFASGNRRTAFIATKDFLLNNRVTFGIKDDPYYARVMLGIRENFYSEEEIKEWICHGKIREFRR